MQESGKTQEASETQAELLTAQAAPVQPVGYGQQATTDPAELVAEQDMVRRTMAKLPETLRTCLLLSLVGGLSTSEIATMLDMKEAAVRQRLARAKKQFQQEYTRESNEDIGETSTSQTSTYRSDKGQATYTSIDKGNQPQHLTLVPPYSWLGEADYAQ